MDGKSSKWGLLGTRGWPEFPSSVGLKKSPLREVIQIAGQGFRIAVRPLQKILMTTPELRNLLSRYAVIQGLDFRRPRRVTDCMKWDNGSLGGF